MLQTWLTGFCRSLMEGTASRFSSWKDSFPTEVGFSRSLEESSECWTAKVKCLQTSLAAFPSVSTLAAQQPRRGLRYHIWASPFLFLEVFGSGLLHSIVIECISEFSNISLEELGDWTLASGCLLWWFVSCSNLPGFNLYEHIVIGFLGSCYLSNPDIWINF